ncbi:hypothetical protein PI125_g10540 [Phytophthora idaei]|nr:hypothetical protein PI125_g10540 [Phytophthora idaei]KAG3138099.1 hypothetical protein PI126_g17076 [Phytophthora idaei]
MKFSQLTVFVTVLVLSVAQVNALSSATPLSSQNDQAQHRKRSGPYNRAS